MAKKKTIIEETVPDSPQPGISPELERAIVKIKVYKIVPGVPQPRYCFSLPSNTAIDEEYLQNSSYGGGRYEVHYVDETGADLDITTYEIADKPQPNTPLSADAVQIQMLREQRQQNHDLLMAVLGSGNAKASTPMSELASMWGIMQGNVGGNGSMNLIDVFMKGLQLGRGVEGGGDWKTMLIEAGREVLPTVAAAVAAHGKQPVSDMFRNPQIPPNGSAKTQPEPQPQPTDAMIKAGIAYMKPRIRAGMDYVLALDWITNNANDPTYEPFINFAMSKTFDDLVAMDSDLANEPYKTWFTNVLAGIKEHFTELAKTDDERD